ncbi:P-loop containing nucleoside triphosphate hydrolase protein, partial [Tirmania nivea]
IVAVHGLNGDAYRTWTWKPTKKGEKEVLWLRDLLPNEIQDARIFTYGYDSMPTQVAGRASTKFIHQHAESFLQDLYAHRKGDEVYRPIIFIAHSLGGILVKQALNNSSDCHVGHNEHLRSILNSTYGIMFIGTPHNGSGLANWGKFAESVISHVFPKVFVDTNPHLINTLGKNSEVLQMITQKFMSIQHQNPFQIFYFWEELKTKLPNGRMELVVEYSSAVLQGAANVQSYGIHGDHTSICRFENEESPGYDVLVRALIDWREAAPDAVSQKWAQYRDQVMLSNIHNNMSPTGSHIGTRKPAPAGGNISPCSSTIHSPKTEPHFIVSHHPNEVFEGREEDLESLDKILQNPKKREKGNASAVVSGISGSGKTHLVRQYVYKKRDNYPGGVFWVEAVSSASIKLGYWKLAVGLGLTERTRFSEEPHGDFFVHLVTYWFQSHSKWLLVLDGADHETDFELSLLKEIIPGGANGAIIITTVNKALAGRARLGSPEGLTLKNLDTQDCVNILFQYARITEPSTEDIKDAEELVELMDFLPLAIHSAGSSMTVMQMDLGNYLRYYKKQPEVEGLTSFHIILDQLHKRYPEASNLIYILSFVERKVPVAMVEWGMKNWNGPPLVAKKHGLGLNVTLGHLLSYSLIERKNVAEVDDLGRVDTLLMHKVVQDICQLRMKQEGRGRLETYFYHASKMFCRSFRRMEQRRRDKNFSVSDYRRFQVHIAKALSHGNAMKLKSLDIGDALDDLEGSL